MKEDNSKSEVEETLDPKDWKVLRGLGRRMIDDMFDYLQNIRSKQKLPLIEEAISEICVPLSDDGEGKAAVYEVFRRSILHYSLVWLNLTLKNPYKVNKNMQIKNLLNFLNLLLCRICYV